MGAIVMEFMIMKLCNGKVKVKSVENAKERGNVISWLHKVTSNEWILYVSSKNIRSTTTIFTRSICDVKLKSNF